MKSPAIDIGIQEADRIEVAKGLSKLLADSYTLYLKTHKYHWNVVGPMFQTLHLMFEGQYTELALAVDLIAERIRSLGVLAPGSYKEFGGLTSIGEEVESPADRTMIANLIQGHEQVAKTARSVHPIAQKGNDEVTLDLITQRLQVHEKTAWMLRSLLEG